MSDEIKKKRAREVYNTLCNAIDSRGWKYKKNEEDLAVEFGVSGDDVPMHFSMFIDEDRQLIRLLSPIPFFMSEDKRIEGAIATCVASCDMYDGSFDYDLSDGMIVFRMTESFRGRMVGEELFQYMVSKSCAAVDQYNDVFFAIDKGLLSIEEFIEKENS